MGLFHKNTSEKEAEKYGIQGPYGQFNPGNIDPSLYQGQGQQQSTAYNPALASALKPHGIGQSARAGLMQAARNPQQVMQQTEAPHGWDMTAPGVAEQFQQQNQGRMTGPSQTTQAYQDAKQSFAAPGQGEQYWNQVAGKFNQPTNAQGAYDRAMKQSSDPGLGAYYDRAKQQTANTMNNQLAAMGLFGSSVGANNMGNAMSALDAERANREADFTLRQNQALSQMGSAADSQNQGLLGLGGTMSDAAQQLGLTRNINGVNAAQAADSSEMSRFNAGLNAANIAQQARQQRTQDMFNNIYGPAQILSGMVGDAQGGILGGDQQLMDATMAAQQGRALDSANYSQNKYQRQINDEKHATEMTKNWMSIGSGMGGMGGSSGKGSSTDPYNEREK